MQIKLIPIEQFHKTYITEDGEKVVVYANETIQCMKCLCILGRKKSEDGKYIELESPCSHCEREK